MTSKASKTSTPAPVVLDATAGTSASVDVTPAIVTAWQALFAALFAPSCHPAWFRRSYVMVRGDKGTGRAMSNVSLIDGTVLAGTWATVCEHGRIAVTSKGASAEGAGQTRRTWCDACGRGDAPTVAGLPGFVPAPVAAPAARKRTSKGASKGKGAPARTAAPAAPAPAPAPARDVLDGPAPGEAPAL